LPENPEVSYAGHPNTYNFLIIIKTTNASTILLLSILLDSTKKMLKLFMHKDKYAQGVWILLTKEKKTQAQKPHSSNNGGLQQPYVIVTTAPLSNFVQTTESDFHFSPVTNTFL